MTTAVWLGASAQVAAPEEGRPDFEVLAAVPDAEVRQMDDLTKYAVACGLLLHAASGETAAVAPERLGVILGTGFGCSATNHQYLETLIAAGPRKVSPIVFRNSVSNAMAGHLALALHALGSSSVLSNGMVSGLQALACAFEEVRKGRCDTVVCGAVDCCSGLDRSRFAAQADRWGASPLALMDGACLVALHAERPAGMPGWRLAGYGMGYLYAAGRATDLARVMQLALDHAGFAWPQVDLVQVQADRGACWVRQEVPRSLDEVVPDLLRLVAEPRFAENTALPAMFALTSSLETLPLGRLPRLLAGKPGRLERVPRRVLFAGLGGDGNAVCLALEHTDRSRPEGRT